MNHETVTTKPSDVWALTAYTVGARRYLLGKSHEFFAQFVGVGGEWWRARGLQPPYNFSNGLFRAKKAKTLDFRGSDGENIWTRDLSPP